MESFDPFADIEEFHKKYGLEYSGKARVLPAHLAKFREKFIREEYNEYLKAVHAAKEELRGKTLSFDDEVAFNLEHAFDALVDLCYIVMGTAYLHGFDFREGWRRVHEANMRKVRATCSKDSKRKSRMDVVKPADWTPPRLHNLVADHAHHGERT